MELTLLWFTYWSFGMGAHVILYYMITHGSNEPVFLLFTPLALCALLLYFIAFCLVNMRSKYTRAASAGIFTITIIWFFYIFSSYLFTAVIFIIIMEIGKAAAKNE